MAARVAPITFKAPGFKGLNTQSASTSLTPDWARVCTNVVFDDSGRLSARKGWTQLTTSAISGTPDIESIIEFKDGKTTRSLVFAANAKLYETSTVTTNYDTNTEIQGSLTPSANNWKFQNFNGKIVASQDGEEPIVFTGTGNFTSLQAAHTDWTTATAKVVNDTVKATSAANPTMYFVVTAIAGTGTTDATTEPTWPTTHLATVIDNAGANQITWTTIILPQGNEIHAAFGRLWAIDSDRTTIKYSGLLLESFWDAGNGGGLIDLTLVKGFTAGINFATAINSFAGSLIIFGSENILIWASPDDPTNLTISDTVLGIGNVTRDAVQNIGDDIIFLDATGLRSLKRAFLTTTLPTSDVSFNVKDGLIAEYNGLTTKTEVKSVYNRDEGFYLLLFPLAVWCVDLRNEIPPEPQSEAPPSFRISRWTNINIQSAAWSDTDNKMYLGQEGGVVGYYNSHLDNTSSYIMEFLSVDTDLGQQGIKIPKTLKLTVQDGFLYFVVFNWSFDFEELDTYVTTPQIPQAGDEWGIGEFDLAEWLGGRRLNQVSIPLSRTGQYFRWGFSVGITGTAIAFEAIDIQMALGRLK